MMYYIEMKSGHDYMMHTDKDVYTIAYEAYEEACLTNDYLVNISGADLTILQAHNKFS